MEIVNVTVSVILGWRGDIGVGLVFCNGKGARGGAAPIESKI